MRGKLVTIILSSILFVIYVNDLPDHLSEHRLLYADDVKLIAPRNRNDTLQNSLNSSASWPKDWELDLDPTKSEHLPIGNPSKALLDARWQSLFPEVPI